MKTLQTVSSLGRALFFSMFFALGLVTVSLAQTTATDAEGAKAKTVAEAKKAFDDARQAAQAGPRDIPLSTQAVLKLPPGHVFIPQPQANGLLRAMGNPGRDSRLLGLIFPRDEKASEKDNDSWFMTLRFEDAGYVKDDDARDWNADDLLKSYREGTEASNEERLKMGASPIEILGWAEKPAYDATTHRLAWAMSSREKGAPADEPQGVNYNTYVLGREGYFSMNLVTGLTQLQAHKPAAQTLLAALNFNDGKRYADFNSSTDKVAEYGLAALVVGVAAKKLGLIAMAGLFLAKFAKVILLGLAVFGAGAMKLFKRKKPVVEPKGAVADAPPAPPTPPTV
jgi:uncharacterized membrane-anchored protein